MASQYKRYNHEAGEFTDWPELQVFDAFDDFMVGVPLSLEKDRVRMSDLGFYDIGATMIRSIRRLKNYKWSIARGADIATCDARGLTAVVEELN